MVTVGCRERAVLDLTAPTKLSGVLREDLRGVPHCTPTMVYCAVQHTERTEQYQNCGQTNLISLEYQWQCNGKPLEQSGTHN